MNLGSTAGSDCNSVRDCRIARRTDCGVVGGDNSRICIFHIGGGLMTGLFGHSWVLIGWAFSVLRLAAGDSHIYI